MAIVAEDQRHRIYLPANNDHEAAADIPAPTWVPDTELAYQPRDIKPPIYGLSRHVDLFTNRQLTALCTFSDLVMESRDKVFTDSQGDTPYADAVATYLALGVSRLADLQNSLACWENTRTQVRHLFSRQAIAMVWDFAEPGLFSNAAGDFATSLGSIANAIPVVTSGLGLGAVEQADAASRSYDALVVSTDPPYYDNIYYSDLADFFYVWLRKALLSVYPDLLGTILTPKSRELVASPYRFGGSKDKAEEHFEKGLAQVFAAAGRQALAGTPLTVFYAFKQSETEEGDSGLDGDLIASTGWEKMPSGLLRSGLAITGTWPMRTELSNRMMGHGMNALASSIVLVCRPRGIDAGVTDRRGFQQSLKARLGHDLRVLQSGGIAPVDLAQAAIGPGMAVFSRYAKVIEADGTAMTVRKALQLINHVLDEVSAEQEGEFDEDTRWAIAWYTEHGIDEGPYGRADDLSRAKNVSVDGLVRAGIVKSGGGKVRLLDRSELDLNWDPTTDTRLTVWEVTQHLIRRLLDDGEGAASDLLARVGGLGDAARDLSYRLFQIAESKRWAKEAGPYNALGAAWPELSRRAAEGPMGQGTLRV
jgi:putative DNA methylase